MIFLNLGEENDKAMMGLKLLRVVGVFREVREIFPRLACSNGTYLKSINCHNFFCSVISNLPLKFLRSLSSKILK